MAADDDLLLLLNYIDTLSPAERVFCQHSNPLQEYNEMKFRQRFRLSKSTVLRIYYLLLFQDDQGCNHRLLPSTHLPQLKYAAVSPKGSVI